MQNVTFLVCIIFSPCIWTVWIIQQKLSRIENNVYSTFHNCTRPFNDVLVSVRDMHKMEWTRIVHMLQNQASDGINENMNSTDCSIKMSS